jgi:hypothetical protein
MRSEGAAAPAPPFGVQLVELMRAEVRRGRVCMRRTEGIMMP